MNNVEELIRIAFEAGVKAAEGMESSSSERKLRRLEINHDFTQWRDNVGQDFERAIQNFKK